MNQAYNNDTCRQVWSTGKRGVSYFINQMRSNRGRDRDPQWRYFLTEVVFLDDGTRRIRKKRVGKSFLDSVEDKPRAEALRRCSFKIGGLNCTEVSPS